MASVSVTPNPELSKGHWIIDGTGWSFSAILYDTTNLQHKNVILDTAHISLFEYTNQWNSLVLTGQLVYKDMERELGKLFRIPHLVLKVEWAENKAEQKEKKNEDGSENGDYWVEKPIKKEDYFNHMFLVNKMELIQHDTNTDVTTYRLELISTSWYKLSQVCQYSNYNLKRPEPITDIICRLLQKAVGEDKVASETFLKEPCKTDVCIYYTTTQKDNYFTAINYLLNRMYMEPSSFDVDNHPRIILWDEKERMYRMAKLNDDTTCLTVRDNLIQLNRFYEIREDEVSPQQPAAGESHAPPPTITSVSKMSYTRFIKDYYTRHYWDMNITKDKFVRRIILNEKVQGLFKSPMACPKRDAANYPNPNITNEDDVPDLQQFLSEEKTNYLIDECKWNNQRHLYNDCIQGITNRDSFTLTRTNRVCHQPWQCFYAIKDEKRQKDMPVLDTDNMKPDEPVDSENKKEQKPKTEENKHSDNQFFGPWYTCKTTHSIVINGTPKESVPSMVERLQLVKCWEINPVPQDIKK